MAGIVTGKNTNKNQKSIMVYGQKTKCNFKLQDCLSIIIIFESLIWHQEQ